MEGVREMAVVYEDENYVAVDKPFDFRLVLPAPPLESYCRSSPIDFTEAGH